MTIIRPDVSFDMDATTFDFPWALYDKIQLCTQLPDHVRHTLQDINAWTSISLRDIFDVSDDERRHIQKIMEDEYQTQDFFWELKLYPGILDMMREVETFADTTFLTTPSKRNCGSEYGKRHSVIKHCGEQYNLKVTQTGDKTRYRSDVHVDDNPTITGKYNPIWKQLLVDQPHNQNETKLRRIYLDQVDKRAGIIKNTLEEHWRYGRI